MTRNTKNIITDFSAALLLAFILTLPFKIFPLDLTLQNLFYSQTNHWYLGGHQPWKFFYYYGNYPILLFSLMTIGLFIYSFLKINQQKLYLRKISLFFIFVLLLGPGLIVNGILKEHCGRPRPRETIQFNGTEPFVNVLEKGTAGKGKSFPCGHCSMAFMLITPYFILRKKRKKTAFIVLFAGLLYGGLMSTARIAQGGHFASDAVWSGLIIYMTSLAVYYGIKIDDIKTPKTSNLTSLHQIIIILISLFTAGLILFGLALATPYYKKLQIKPPQFKTQKSCSFYFTKGHIQVIQHNKIVLSGTAQGFGLPKSRLTPLWSETEDKINFRLQKTKGLFTELRTDLKIFLKPEYKYSIYLQQGLIEVKNPSSLHLALTNLKGDILIYCSSNTAGRIALLSDSVSSDFPNTSSNQIQPVLLSAYAPEGKIIIKQNNGQ